MILQEIKNRLKTEDYSKLSKALGYNNTKNFEKTLKNFLNCKNLHEWFGTGHYDFVNKGEEFFTKLAKEINIDEEVIQETIKEEEIYQKELKRFEDAYIFVNTNFKRTTQPIFVLAFTEGIRNLRLYGDEELLFKSTDEILEIISKKVKKHYEDNNGELKIWGKIATYQVHLEGKTYIFDKDGILQKNKNPIYESKATISLK